MSSTNSLKAQAFYLFLIIGLTTLAGSENTLIAQDGTPPSDINSYMATRARIAKAIISDLKSANKLTTGWPRKHTSKLIAEAGTLQAKYKKNSNPKQGTDRSFTWSDWVAKEVLHWETIESQLTTFGGLHNNISKSTNDVKKYIADNREMVRTFNPYIQKMDLVMERGSQAIDYLNRHKAKFPLINYAYSTTTGSSPLLKELPPVDRKLLIEAAITQLKVVMPQLQSRYYSVFKTSEFAYQKNIFVRELPHMHRNLQKATKELYSQIRHFELYGGKTINSNLLKYSGLKRLADLQFYRTLDEQSDDALTATIKRHTDVRAEWEKMVNEYAATVMPPELRKEMRPDFSNASKVLEKYEKFALDIKNLEPLYKSLVKALKKTEEE